MTVTFYHHNPIFCWKFNVIMPVQALLRAELFKEQPEEMDTGFFIFTF